MKCFCPGMVLPMERFDAPVARKSLSRIPAPGGGTAIGTALQEGFKSLFKTGCERKFLIVVTDGESNTGPDPEATLKQLHEQTKGEVTVVFVAFDTSPVKFGFLKNYNGSVMEASNGPQLKDELSKIYKEQILLEAVPRK